MVIEVFKSLQKLNPELLWDIFVTKKPVVNLRSGKLLSLPPNGKYTTQYFAFRASLAWNYR